MPNRHDLIPPPPAVREELAASLRRASLLRRLLRLSVRAAEERQRQALRTPRAHFQSARDKWAANDPHYLNEAASEAGCKSGAPAGAGVNSSRADRLRDDRSR